MKDRTGTRRGAAGEPRVPAAPSGLAVERFEVGGDEYALLAWSADEPAPPLTPAERAVLAQLATGASNAAIAAARGVSVRTVANQVASLLDKLRAGSRYELIRRYGRSGDARRAP